MPDAVQTAPKRCWIRLGGHDIEVRPGQTLIGRHETCHIVIDDPLASRRHARLLWEDGRLRVEDLGSVNGIVVNGKRIEQATEISNGDEVRLGNQRIEVFMAGTDAVPRRGVATKTLVGAKFPIPDVASQEEATVVRDGEALTTLALVAEKVLAMGRGTEAERVLEKALHGVSARVGRAEKVEPDTLELASNCAVRLAETMCKGAWVDYVIELHVKMRSVLPSSVVDRLYGAVRSVGPINMDRLRLYIEILRERQQSLGPGELFLLRRIEGLERLFALK